MVTTQFFPPIGLSGAAGVGKDTLCSVLLKDFKVYPFKRYSMAGDSIKKDLYELLKKTINISTFTRDQKEKTYIRPLLVEYGRLMRNQTKGRYFIEKLQQDENFGKGNIPIITDIRYAEYETDELHWIKQEQNGLLVFLDREGIEPSNEFEEKNNIILKNNSHLYFKIENNTNYSSILYPIAQKIIEIYNKNLQSPLANRAVFSF